jgi:hypothetical protein
MLDLMADAGYKPGNVGDNVVLGTRKKGIFVVTAVVSVVLTVVAMVKVL